MRTTLSLLGALVALSLFTPAARATNAPSNVVATAVSSSQINLSWTDNSSDEIGFTFAVDTNPSFTNPTYVWTGGVNVTSYAHTGLSAATTYFYKIKAEGNPDSAWTAVAHATTAPSGVGASAASSTQINVTWSGNSGNGNIVGYTVAVAANSAFNGAAYHFVNGAGATSYSSTGLASGTTYYYKVKAEGTSDSYDSPFTAAVSATTTSTAPNPPSNLSGTAVSSSQVDLTWTDNSANETGFEVKRATDSGFTQNVVWIGGIQGTSYSNTGLAAGTTYYYKVRAQGATQNSAYSNAISVTTGTSGTIPAAPSNLSATAVGTTQVNLSWSDNSSNETGFEVKRATDSGFTQNVVWIGGISGSTYANTGLTPNTTYYYKVRAEGTAGKSAYSSAVSVTTGTSTPTNGTPISRFLFGNNAWMPPAIGLHNYNGKLVTDPDDAIWTKIVNSGVVSMRYGGHGVDQYADPALSETMDQYVAMVEAMRSKGIEPVIQVPVLGNTFSASQAADIVRTVNFSPTGTRLSRAVTYWVIGNEPDLHNQGYGATGFSPHDVATYIKSFASAMKAVDPQIKIIAPETAWYDTDIIGPLTTCSPSFGADDVTGFDASGRAYVDYISFHYYGFDPASPPSRTSIISKLSGFDANLSDLATKIGDCNSRHSRLSNPIKIAVTEANINWAPNDPSDDVYGVGAKSFIGGQFWAEMLGVAMKRGVDILTFWSTVEGSGGLSYLTSDATGFYPSYYHFQMVAKNLRGNAVTVSGAPANLKAFAAIDTDQIAVLLMNQDQLNAFDYTLRLDTGTVSGTRTVKIKADAGVAAEYNDTIATESSVVLIFNTSGTLTKKIEYKLYGNANNGLPPTTTP